MVLRFFMLALAFFFISCTEIVRNNPDDPGSPKYVSELSSSAEVPLSSEAVPSSSSVEVPLSSEAVPSSSSIALSSSSESTKFGPGPSVTHGGEIYQTVEIGTQTWFKRNLNVNITGSRCYGDDSGGDSEGNCSKYGRLYDWAMAMELPTSCNTTSCSTQISAGNHKGICPSGWHIPSEADWNRLITAVGGNSTAGKYLKTNAWNGEDTYGFSALSGGYGECNWGKCSFKFIGSSGGWWSSSNGSTDNADVKIMTSSDNVTTANNPKDYVYSVRCVKD
ncbi:MAG: hypothetical protein LBC75_13330 [Fibromonadaceae bacterium]|jgi:uncharacterized protein (TIGR02145 family)|nr:hypothetical protein [Fibromonadaceae bacterium]